MKVIAKHGRQYFDSRRVFKFLTASGGPIFGQPGNYWSAALPIGKRPGRWMRVSGRIKLCFIGLHLAVGESGVYEWQGAWDGRRCFLAEYRGEARGLKNGAKIVCQEVRLLREIKRTLRDRYHSWYHVLKTRGLLKPRSSR